MAAFTPVYIVDGARTPFLKSRNLPGPFSASFLATLCGCGNKGSGWTVMRNCATGMQAIDSAIANILLGRSQLVLAGGAVLVETI